MKLSDRASVDIQSFVKQIDLKDPLKGMLCSQFLKEIAQDPDENIKFIRPEWYDINDPLILNEGDFLKTMPTVQIVGTQSDNYHFTLHSSREFLLRKGLLKELKMKNELSLTHKRIFTISGAAGMEKLFPFGNYFINQALTKTYSDKERIIKNYIKCFNMINSQYIDNRDLIIRTKIVKENQLVEANLKPQCNSNFDLLNTNICHCFQRDEPCVHMVQFKPEIVLLPHSAYYLSSKWISKVTKMFPGVKIFIVAHIFAPNQKEGVIKSHHIYELPKLMKDNEKNEEKLVTKKQYSEDVIANWTQKNGNIHFETIDEEIYDHKSVLNKLYDCSRIQGEEYCASVAQRIIHDGMHHVCIIIKGSLEIEEAEKLMEPKQSSLDRFIVSKTKSLLYANQHVKEGQLFIVENEKDDSKILIRKLKNENQMIHFRIGSISQGLLQKFKSCFKMSKKKSDDILSFDFNSFITDFELEMPENEVLIENEMYQGLMDQAYINFSEEINEESISRMKRIISAFLMGKKFSNSTINTILINLIKDVYYDRILTKGIASSYAFKNYDKLNTEDQYTMLEKIESWIFGSVKLDQDLKIVKEENKQSFESRDEKKYDISFYTNEEIAEMKNKEKIEEEKKVEENSKIVKAYSTKDKLGRTRLCQESVFLRGHVENALKGKEVIYGIAKCRLLTIIMKSLKQLAILNRCKNIQGMKELDPQNQKEEIINQVNKAFEKIQISIVVGNNPLRNLRSLFEVMSSIKRMQNDFLKYGIDIIKEYQDKVKENERKQQERINQVAEQIVQENTNKIPKKRPYYHNAKNHNYYYYNYNKWPNYYWKNKY